MNVHSLARLNTLLEHLGPVGVAVSGGVDSMTLSVIAHRALGAQTRMYHAVSAAVPANATERVRHYARRDGWKLTILDAGEFEDPRYLANPVNRCYFCKSDLYSTIPREHQVTLLSGTNLDDLGDYRPGLRAAKAHDVRHPYVEAGIDKAGVRSLAHGLGLHDLAELPAAPCLSSRIETGIAIDAAMLGAVYRAERLIASALVPRTVRCRVRRDAVVIELDADSLALLDDENRAQLAQQVRAQFVQVGIESTVDFQAYRMGSAFLRAGSNG